MLGILLMNIWSFAGPQAIYDYPIAASDWGGAPLQTWAVMHTLFEGSQRALFSILFGAGMLLMVNRLDERTPTSGSAKIYYRRLVFLMLFGLFDLFVLLWPADILFIYALCGLVLYPLRNLRPRTLLLLALIVFSLQGGLRVLNWQESIQLRAEYAALQADPAQAANTDEASTERKQAWEAIEQRAHPDLNSPKTRELIRITGSGGFGEFLASKLQTSLVLLIVVGLKSLLLDSLGAMLIGMALLRSGVLTMAAAPRSYFLLAVLGYGIGLPLAAWETTALIGNDFDPILKARNLIHYDFRRMAIGLGPSGLDTAVLSPLSAQLACNTDCGRRTHGAQQLSWPVDTVRSAVLYRWFRTIWTVHRLLPVSGHRRHLGDADRIQQLVVGPLSLRAI